MKKRNVAMAIVLAAAVGTASLAACGGNKNKGGEFNLSDYAAPLTLEAIQQSCLTNQSFYSEAFTKIAKKDFTGITDFGGFYNSLAVVTVKDGENTTYSLYDLKQDKVLFSSCTNIQRKYAGSMAYYMLTETANEETTYRFVGPDGKLLVNKSFKDQNSFTLTTADEYQGGDYYVNGCRATIYQAEYAADEAQSDNKTLIYFASYTDEDENQVWVGVMQNEISDENDSDREDDCFGLEKMKFLPEGAEAAYPGNDIDDYYITLDGQTDGLVNGTIKFYNGKDENTATYTIENGMYLGESFPILCGDYFFMYEEEAVSPSATKGYNKETVNSFGLSEKTNYTYYRLNYKEDGKKEKLESEYIINAAYPLYNYKEKKFDKFYAECYKMEKGVAFIGEATRTYKLVLDENFNVCADFTSKTFVPYGLIKLADDRYFSEVDSPVIFYQDGGVAAQLPDDQYYIWQEENLLVSSSTGMAVDYDGYVVIEPITHSYISSSVKYYGDSAYYNGKIYNRNNRTGCEYDVLIQPNEGEEVNCSDGVIYKKTPVKDTDGEQIKSYTYTVYDLKGEVLGVIENVANTLTFSLHGDMLVVTGQIKVTTGETETTENGVWIIS